ncbi:S8 family peptidase [Clostridium magnum]|uniref:Thermophilic serine proteinase n=1 Tax=Clostridium magnum DSM 2767 TaxID=1121326 RepID=A0A162TQ32_9CLOT|nr:S8 family peptidase [Clostridium magnum]KZL92910.1 thermophilic serine proteinase precursor [Clostridium magnum DSM 2767]SHJ15959.1 Subtilase family protein [Clostridium magnum DSM 2767]
MVRKIIAGITAASILFAVSSLSPYSHIKNNIGYDSSSNSINDLEKVSINSDSSNFLIRLKHLQIVRLPNGGYILISHNMQGQDILDRTDRTRGTQIVETPKNIEIIKPIERTPVKKDFKLGEINQNNSTAVNDPGYKYEWDISYTQADKAWPLINQKREVKVAVLDTGIDYTHPDLKNRVLLDKGYNFIDNSYDAMDDNGHGTHVSGIIAAEANNKIGISGIVGNLDVKIIPVKVLDENGEGEENNVARGIVYAVDKGADIVNLSFGIKSKSRLIADAINYAKSKGVFVVAASGNDNENSDNYSPAGDGAFAVAAMNYNYKKAYFSDYGNSIKVAAPGVKILSTVPGGYEAWDGTSMAAPVVSGIAAMVKSENPLLSSSQIEDILDSTAKDIMYKGKDQQSGYGLIDAYSAIKKVKELEKNNK